MSRLSAIAEYAQEYITEVPAPKQGVIDILRQYGNQDLEEYARCFRENPAEPMQPREDLLHIVRRQSMELFGESLAEALVSKLEKTPVILTANHHGVDYHPLYVQGALVFALPELLNSVSSPKKNVVPILSFGSVSLNNATFPRGILLHPSQDCACRRSYQKVSVFPDHNKHAMVSFTPAFTREMVQKARASTLCLHQRGAISDQIAVELDDILENEYLSEKVLKQDCFSSQVSLLNLKLWQRVLGPRLGAGTPAIIYLEIEKIVSELLQRDMDSDLSLGGRVLFDKALRNHLLTSLNGQSGCWDLTQKHKGTFFFWAIDPRDRRVPLEFTEEGGRTWLVGQDAHGTDYRFSMTPAKLKQALADRKLLPGMFLCFLATAFARGMRCFGGPWQTTYLPAIQAGLVEALRGTSGYGTWAEQVASVPTANYVSGMTVALARNGDSLCAAGMVELSTSNGLGREDIELLRTLQVEKVMLNDFLLDKGRVLNQLLCVRTPHPQALVKII